MLTNRRLIASRLTPCGRGAVATIRVCGECQCSDDLNALFSAANQIPIANQPLKRIAFGQWGRGDVEEIVVCRIAPNNLEIYCHGGEAAVQRILRDLADAGCDIVDWRAQEEKTNGILAMEFQDVLSKTSTWRTTRIVLEQANGMLKRAFSRLAELSSQDEGLFQEQLHELIRWSSFGIHLSIPWSVVLTGRPNVGKSSLINALLGYQRAIVFDQPGTTRDIVTGETAFDGWPVVIADTAGIRAEAVELEAAGIALARNRLQSADLRILLIDAGQPLEDEDRALIAEWPDSLIVVHKSDLRDRSINDLPKHAILVSSVSGEGMAELQGRLVERLIPAVPVSGTPIPLTNRQVECLKKIREAATHGDRQRSLGALVDGISEVNYASLLGEQSSDSVDS